MKLVVEGIPTEHARQLRAGSARCCSSLDLCSPSKVTVTDTPSAD